MRDSRTNVKLPAAAVAHGYDRVVGARLQLVLSVCEPLPSHSHSITLPLRLRSWSLNSAEAGGGQLERQVGMARDFHAVQAQHPHAASAEIPMRVGVVAQRQPGCRFGGAGRGDLQVEALDATVRGARGDVEAVAPALARAGGEQPVAAAVDLQQPGGRVFFFFAPEGPGARGVQRAADARVFGLVGEADQVADARVHRERIRRVDVLDAVHPPADSTGGQRRARWTDRGGRQEHFEREVRELRVCKRGHADQIETVLGGLERERGLAMTFGLLTAHRIELRAHGVIDVDRGVQLAASRQVERDPLQRFARAGCTRRSGRGQACRRIRVRPVRSWRRPSCR